MRGLAIARYEDKIVQMALKKIIEGKKISYIVDADIKGFFDHIDWKWLIKCVEQHIKDQRIIRLTKRFLRADIYYVLVLWFEKNTKEFSQLLKVYPLISLKICVNIYDI